MKSKPFACLIISMIGLYAIFSALLVAGIPLVMLVMGLFVKGIGLEYLGYTSLMCVPQFVLPFTLGVFLFRRAAWIADKILARSVIDPASDVFPKSDMELGGLAFSLLGVFMLTTTVPGALQDLAAWFQYKASTTTNFIGSDSGNFWSDRFPVIVNHLSAVGFSLYVFLRGQSVADFLKSIRRAGLRSVPRENLKPEIGEGGGGAQ